MIHVLRRRLLAGAVAAPMIARPALAQGGGRAAAPAPANAGFHRRRVGGFTATFLFDGIAPSPLEGMVINRPIEAVRAVLAESFLATDHFPGTYTAVVVETGRGTVLFDAGTGGQLAPTAGSLISNLRAAGIEPAAVSAVVLTHCHGDHITGLTTAAGEAVFPNAELVVPEAEWRFWTDRGNEAAAPARQRPNFANVARRFAPYAARTRRVAEGAEAAPGIVAVSTPGHSPGHTSWLVADGADQLLVLGDVAHRPELFVRRPDFQVVFDYDPVAAEATRRRVLDRVAADRVLVTGYHFPFPAHGHIARDGGEGFRFVPSNWQG